MAMNLQNTPLGFPIISLRQLLCGLAMGLAWPALAQTAGQTVDRI
jgi:hypothetical protein